MTVLSQLRRIRGHTIWTNRLGPDSVVVDAGAHKGEFSAMLHERYGCRCVLIEANPDLASALRESGKGEVIHAALSDRDGEATFHFSENPEAGSIATSSGEAAGRSVTVPTLSLEHVLSRTGGDQIDVLKLDIEGAEFALLANTPDRILTRIGQITVEFHDFLPAFADPSNVRNACERLKRLGFRRHVLTIRGHGDVLFVNSNTERIGATRSLLARILGKWIIKFREITQQNT